MRDAKRVARTQLTEAAAHLGPGYKPILDDQIVEEEDEGDEELEFGTNQIGPQNYEESAATDGDTASHNKLDNFLRDEIFPKMQNERTIMLSRQLEREGITIEVLQNTAKLSHGDRSYMTLLRCMSGSCFQWVKY
jgi:hypothetical protein